MRSSRLLDAVVGVAICIFVVMILMDALKPYIGRMLIAGFVMLAIWLGIRHRQRF